jgi:hypothetical protein
MPGYRRGTDIGRLSMFGFGLAIPAGSASAAFCRFSIVGRVAAVRPAAVAGCV